MPDTTTISHLRAGLRRTEHRVSANKQRALYAENEAVTLERQKEQLQSKIEQMRKGIDELKRTHSQRLDEAKDDMQKVIVEKENELREAYCKLEDKEKELCEQKIEVERVSRRLEAADRDMEEKSNTIKELKREEAVLRAELHSMMEKVEMLTEKALYNPTPPTITADSEMVCNKQVSTVTLLS